jgi:hypothetical protein
MLHPTTMLDDVGQTCWLRLNGPYLTVIYSFTFLDKNNEHDKFICISF